MIYVVMHEGEPVFLSANKQLAIVVAKLYCAFYYGMDFEVRAEGAVTAIVPNVEDSTPTLIYALNQDDVGGLNRLIEAAQPVRKEEKVAKRSIIRR